MPYISTYQKKQEIGILPTYVSTYVPKVGEPITPRVIKSPGGSTIETLPSGLRKVTLPESLGGGSYITDPRDPKELILTERAYGGLKTESETQRDHKISVAIGGTSDRENIKRMEVKVKAYKDNVERYYISQYKAGKISLGGARVKIVNWDNIDIPNQKAFNKTLNPGILEVIKGIPGAIESIGKMLFSLGREEKPKVTPKVPLAPVGKEKELSPTELLGKSWERRILTKLARGEKLNPEIMMQLRKVRPDLFEEIPKEPKIETLGLPPMGGMAIGGMAVTTPQVVGKEAEDTIRFLAKIPMLVLGGKKPIPTTKQEWVQRWEEMKEEEKRPLAEKLGAYSPEKRKELVESIWPILGGIKFTSLDKMSEQLARNILKIRAGASTQEVQTAFKTALHKPEIREILRGLSKTSGAKEMDLITKARDILLKRELPPKALVTPKIAPKPIVEPMARVKPKVGVTPKELEPLAREARKYKSAEEFVSGQQKVFRAGEKVDISKIGDRGLPVTTEKKVAERFLKGREDFRKGLPFLEKEPIGIQEFYLSPSAKIATRNDIPIELFQKYKATKPSLYPEKGETMLGKWAKENGFDAIDYRTLGKVSLKEAEIKVINPNIIKTKSQLQDFYTQATKGVVPVTKVVSPKELKPLVIEAGKLKSAMDILHQKAYKQVGQYGSIMGEDLPRYEKLVKQYTKLGVNDLSKAKTGTPFNVVEGIQAGGKEGRFYSDVLLREFGEGVTTKTFRLEKPIVFESQWDAVEKLFGKAERTRLGGEQRALYERLEIKLAQFRTLEDLTKHPEIADFWAKIDDKIINKVKGQYDGIIYTHDLKPLSGEYVNLQDLYPKVVKKVAPVTRVVPPELEPVITEVSVERFIKRKKPISIEISGFDNFINKESSLGKLRTEINIINGQRLSGKITAEEANKSIRKIRDKISVLAEKNGIAEIVKGDKAFPAIRRSGFFATKEIQIAPIRNVYDQLLPPHLMALKQDGFKLGEPFGEIFKKVWKPTEKAIRNEKEFNVETVKTIKDLGKKYRIKINKENLEHLSDVMEGKTTAVGLEEPYLSELRSLLDRLRNEANVVREAMGKTKIGYIEDYIPHIQKATLWNELLSNKATISDNLDFIIPNQIKNPFAYKRLLEELPQAERNLYILLDRYVGVIGKDIYITPAIENIKAYNNVLKNREMMDAFKYWGEYIRTGLIGKQHKLDAALSIGQMKRKALQKWNHMVNLAFLTGKVAWNIATQPLSYIMNVPMETGILNSANAIYKSFSKSLRQYVKENSNVLAIKSSDIRAMAIGEGRNIQNRIYRTKIDKYNDFISMLSAIEERELTLTSYIAGLDKAKSLGYKGKEALWFADLTTARTQSMYNKENRALILNSDIARTVFPFSSFSVEMFNHLKEITIKASGAMKLTYRQRFGKLFGLLVGLYLSNLYSKAVTGRSKTTIGTFFPFIGNYIDLYIAKAVGEEYTGGRNPITVIQIADDIRKGAKNFIEHGDLKKLRKVAINFGLALGGIGGGGQINNLIDGIMANIDEDVKNVKGEVMFEVKDVLSKVIAPIFGVWATKEGREYWDSEEDLEEVAPTRGKSRLETEIKSKGKSRF